MAHIYIEADIIIPSLGNISLKAPVLVVENTDYNRRVPVIIVCGSKLQMSQTFLLSSKLLLTGCVMKFYR